MGIFDFFRNKPSPSPPPFSRSAPPPPEVSDEQIEAADAKLRALRLAPAIGEVGGFQPPDDPCTSWFGRGVGHPGEGLPDWEGRPMVPLLQINLAELPFVPPALEGTALLVVFFDTDDMPFDQPHGQGWAIREYASLDGLVPLPAFTGSGGPRPFPVRWSLGPPEEPSWDDADELLGDDLAPAIDALRDEEEDRFVNAERTKVGGYPTSIQHEVGLKDYVFQIGSEQKTRWYWGDAGVAYFFKSAEGEWRWGCQFY